MLNLMNLYIDNQYTSFGDALNEYNNLCHSVVKSHVKVKTVNVSKVRQKWMDSEYLKSRSERRKLYKRWVRTRNVTDRI